MLRERTYLDFNATAPLRPSARSRMIEALDVTGNASSIHAEGRRARDLVETARAEVAGLVGARPEHVTLTSGATEAAALALSPDLHRQGQAVGRLLVGATEHPAILQGHRFASECVEVVPVLGDGTLDLDALRVALAQSDAPVALALQAANSETGVIQPVAEAAALVHAQDGVVVCDAVQAAGRIDCRFEALGADVILLSAHKLGGPQGVGAMVLAGDRVRVAAPLVRGGGQERGLRGGTENVAAIAGFGAATRDVDVTIEGGRMAALRDTFEAGLYRLAPDAVIFGAGALRLPNTSAFAVPGIANETVLIGLDLEGFAVSAGSACSSGKVARSHVLAAMRIAPHLMDGLIRISFGWSSVEADVDGVLTALDAVLRRVRERAIRSAA